MGGSVRVTRPVNGVEGTALYEALTTDGELIPGPRISLVGLMHGNEPVGESVFAWLEPRLPDQLGAGSVLIVRANLEAHRLGLRHTPDGTDLNRCWDADTLQHLAELPEHERCYEHRRALALAPLLIDSDAILDLHSTSRPSAPFLVFRDDQRHAMLVRRLGVERTVTGMHEDAILGGGMCPDVGLRPGERGPHVGFTYEAGQHGDESNRAGAIDVAVRFLSVHGVWRKPLAPKDVVTRTYEVMDRFQQAPASSEPYRFVGYAGGEQAADTRGRLRRLVSFEPIHADEVLLMRGRVTAVRAQSPFTMLLPCPTAEPGQDLYYVAQERPSSDFDRPVRTHAHARVEGEAIERMLDLLDDDECARGTTWVSFDSRRVLDLCADLILRVSRLPVGHPHRGITVVGRGDWGGDEAEERAGRRYRQAFRTAVGAGLDVDRVQLLRGAPLGWLRALTSGAMARLLDERRRNRALEGADGSGIRLWLSARQPHTVSLLVAGDLGRALAEGDLRHVRVAMVVEAATVMPDGATPQVRIVRLGIISARHEILRAAHTLLRSLRVEHRRLLGRPELRRDLAPLLDSLGGVVAPVEQDRLSALGDTLRRLQVGLWREALQRDLPTPVTVASVGELGHYLARIMASTGIMDGAALRALLVDDATPLRLDPGRLDAFTVEPWRLRDRAGVRRSAPPQPLRAVECDADNLERWMGWKRFLNGRHGIPDVRGKDVDLEFSERQIQRRISRWLREARDLSIDRPGHVLVVIAGDGASPEREHGDGAMQLLDSHREVLLDPAVRYLRIQHAQGTWLCWMKGLIDTLRHRPSGGAPVSIQWEVEHGASINVVIVATWDELAGTRMQPWSLDGWRIERCGVIVSELEASRADYKVAMFTEAPPGWPDKVNLELLHFGRAHCAGLLLQGGRRLVDVAGPEGGQLVDRVMVEQIAHWAGRAREARPGAHLGIADRDLAKTLTRVPDAVSVQDWAARVWADVRPWPA